MASQYEKRKAKLAEEKASESEEKQAPPMDRDAFDIFWDDEKKKFMRVEVSYSLETGEAKVKEVIDVADAKAVAIHKMKELFTKKLWDLKYK